VGPGRALLKRTLDLAVALVGLLLLWPLILVGWVAAKLSSGGGGFFRQPRVGRDGRTFRILKLQTMRPQSKAGSPVTAGDDPRITPTGRWLRKLKLDELPQLWNVLTGDMSLVGPRPDVPGFADRLEGEERRLLALRPGITGPATLVFKEEEELLAGHADPERYNREVIWPTKVALNLVYLDHYHLRLDLLYILATVLPPLRRRVAPAFRHDPAAAARDTHPA
jgi:lipopolysaccharide/colanic/teichoic acid biosynthesis glycosyltransferase